MTEKVKDILVNVGIIIVVIASFLTGIYVASVSKDAALTPRIEYERGTYVLYLDNCKYYVTDSTAKEIMELMKLAD